MDNLPAVKKNSDMTASEVERVTEFMESGLPGVAEITDGIRTQMLEMYLNGSSYSQISTAFRAKRVLVLYFAHTGEWERLRQEYVRESQEGIKNRLVNLKLKGQEFVMLTAQSYQKKLTENFLNYLSTGDVTHMNAVNPKDVMLVLKVIEMNNSLDEEGKDKNGKPPSIGLNAGTNGVLVERIGENTLSITPQEEGGALKRFIEAKRAKEKQVTVVTKETDDEEE